MSKYQDRCDDCKHFQENGVKCPFDSHKRRVIYALDYKCDAFEMKVRH